MIDESGCYVQSAELRPPLQYPCEKMDICYNSPVNNTRGVAEGEAECGGDNEWEEEEDDEEKDQEEEDGRGGEEADGDKDRRKNRHNGDNASIVGATEEADTSGGAPSVGFPPTALNVAGGKHFQKGRKKQNKCLPSRIADRYGQRPRTIIRRIMLEKGLRDRSPQKAPGRAKLQTLSKYRKKSVSAREWCHMQEINLAFESLRNALPMGYSNAGYSDTSAAAKMTTLRLALRYITTLTQLLQDDQVSPSTDDECHGSCCSGEHNYYTASNNSSSSSSINNSGSNSSCSDHNEACSYRDVGVSLHRDLESEDKNSLSKRTCLDYNRHALENPLPNNNYSTHRTSLHHDRHKRPRYHTEKDDSHEALDSGGRHSLLASRREERDGKEGGGERERREVEQGEEDDPEIYIEAISGIFKEPSSSFDEEESCPCQKDVHITRHKGGEPPPPLLGSVTLPKTRPSPQVMEGHGGDPCSAEDFGDLTDYHSESHLEVLDDLKQLSDAESDVLLLATDAGGALSKDLT